jgi:hypothetical protein
MAETRPDGGLASRVRTERVCSPLDSLLFALLSVAGLWALTRFGIAWWAAGLGGQPVLVALLAVTVAMILVNQQGRWFLLLPMRRPLPLPSPDGLRVAVVTTYVPGAESVEMIEATLRAMTALEYPHDTWLLDEGNDPAMRACCERLGVRHFTRDGKAAYQQAEGRFRTASKHGNYNAWLTELGYRDYDILLAFDPDHVPLPGYLGEVLGFFRDPAVGYVQVAQAYYNQAASLVARGAAEETYAYFSVLQMAGYGMGYPIIVGGHNVHRMSALEAVGGLAPHDADDLLLTIRYRSAGWDGVYLPRILARGLTPVDWRGYLVQQRRWARSVLDLKLRHHGIYATSLPPGSRAMSMLHGLNFLHRSAAYFLAMLILLYLLVTAGTLPMLTTAMLTPTLTLMAVLGAQEMFRQRFYLDWRSEAGLHWRGGVLGFAKWPWFLLALVDVLTGRKMGYVITRKTPGRGGYPAFVAWHAGLAGLVALAWVVGAASGDQALPLTVAAGLTVVTAAGLALDGNRIPPPPYVPGTWQPPPGRTPPPDRSTAATN